MKAKNFDRIQSQSQFGGVPWHHREPGPIERSHGRGWVNLTLRVLGSAFICGLLAMSAPNVAAAPVVEPLLIVYGPALGVPFSGLAGIAIDARRSEVLISNTGQHRIEIYSMKGRLHARFTHKVLTRDGRRLAGLPSGLLIDPAGNTLVVDQLAGYVDVLNFRGREIARLELGKPEAGIPSASIVAGVTVAPNGDIFVASGGDAARIYRFDARYRPQGWWDAAAEGSPLHGIRGLSALPDGRLVIVCSAGKPCVRIFSAAGEFVNGFGAHEVGPGNFSNPSGVAVTADGRIWVSDEIRQSVQVFDDAGSFLGTVEGAGIFDYPSAIATDGREFLAVTERVGNRFSLLKIR